MATRLDDSLVIDALDGLIDWTGDEQRITRRVQLPERDAERVLGQIATAADCLDHHPVIERDGDELTFALWTHSLDGVSELDIMLASRIDELLLQAGVPALPDTTAPSAPQRG